MILCTDREYREMSNLFWIHALADDQGRLCALFLTGGEAHDCPAATTLIRRKAPPKYLMGDRAYDSAPLRGWMARRGTKAVIPNKCNRIQPFSFNKTVYRSRNKVERAFNRLKDFRRIFTRYDRLARNFMASVCLVATLVWWV